MSSIEEANISSGPAKEIMPIDRTTVHRICSGQVILNLAIAVKELVENALDAGATTIEVKFQQQGLECIEVIDNGSGVEEANFEGLAAKHHTSKIRDFADLVDVHTFGFRGEALSSLCAVADMMVITRHSSAEFGTKLMINHVGQIESRTVCPRPQGTTVVLRNIFANLPVRRREFQRHVKNEFHKMSNILRAYGLVSSRCRIIATDQSDKGTKRTILATTVSNSIRNNIVSVFGASEANQLIEIKQPMRENETLTQELVRGIDMSIQIPDDELDSLRLSRFYFDGFISSCAHGSGRPARDRQYFYINSRPCEPKHLIKLVNDVYRMHNNHQYPFIVLNILVENTEIDINVTPDKRQILVNQEKILLLALKKSLLKTFNRIPSTYKKQNQDISMTSNKAKLITDFIRPSQIDDSIDEQMDESEDGGTSPLQPQRRNVIGDLSQLLKRKHALDSPPSEDKVRKTKMKKINEFLFQSKQVFGAPKILAPMSEDSESSRDSVDTVQPRGEDREQSFSQDEILPSESISKLSTAPEFVPDSSLQSPEPNSEKDSCYTVPVSRNENQLKIEEMPPDKMNVKIADVEEKRHDSSVRVISDQNETTNDNAAAAGPSEQVTTISSSIGQIRDLLAHENMLKAAAKEKQPQFEGMQFKSKILPSNNKLAEQELETSICKQDFERMEIIGQFNSGFIIVRLNYDLFIVDQHAADEKFNFETLEEETVLQSQKLTVPEALILNPTSESILLDHLQLFELNGFKFEVDGGTCDDNADGSITTRRVKLAAKPFSKNWSFGREDIDELIFMIQEMEGRVDCVLRPSKVRSMFASRACRMSVMVGHHLSKTNMKRVVSQLGTIKYPWNCPHGRPTIRHLINLMLISSIKDNHR